MSRCPTKRDRGSLYKLIWDMFDCFPSHKVNAHSHCIADIVHCMWRDGVSRPVWLVALLAFRLISLVRASLIILWLARPPLAWREA